MALASVIAGPYTTSFRGNSMGITEQGVRLVGTISKQTVTGDAYGDSVFDAVYRGGNWTAILESIEYGLAINAVTSYASFGLQGQVGRMDVGSSIAGPLVLNAVAGTTATANPASLTAAQAILSENQRTELEFSTKYRKVPLEFRLNLYDSQAVAGQPVIPTWFTVT